MALSLATIELLEAELIARVKGVPAFAGSGFSVFDIADFSSQATAQTLPVVGVAYDGAEAEGNAAISAGTKTHASSLVTVQFVIVVAVQYRYTGQDDTKQTAFALLDQVRAAVMGFKGVNTRPWVFVGERPEAAASGDGVIFYSQVWQTVMPIVGLFNNV